MVIPPVPGTGSLKLYLVVTNDGPDAPLVIPTWACDLATAEAAAEAHKGVLYRAELHNDYRPGAQQK